MFVCHACRRRTQAVRTRPNELACVRCGVVGFVEEIEADGSPGLRRTVSEQEREEAARYGDPFTLLSALMRDLPLEISSPDRRITVIAGGGGPSSAFLGSPDSFLQFLPDAMTRITMDNLHNLVYYILAQQQGSEGPPPAARSVLQSLPKEILTAERVKTGEECAICQEEFKAGEEVTHMSRNSRLCPHYFHTHCIVPWLERHNTCCVCRFQLPTDDETYERRREVLQTNLSRSMSSQNRERQNQTAPVYPSNPPPPTAAQTTRRLNPGAPPGSLRPSMVSQGGFAPRPFMVTGNTDEPSYAHVANYTNNQALPTVTSGSSESPLRRQFSPTNASSSSEVRSRPSSLRFRQGSPAVAQTTSGGSSNGVTRNGSWGMSFGSVNGPRRPRAVNQNGYQGQEQTPSGSGPGGGRADNRINTAPVNRQGSLLGRLASRNVSRTEAPPAEFRPRVPQPYSSTQVPAPSRASSAQSPLQELLGDLRDGWNRIFRN